MHKLLAITKHITLPFFIVMLGTSLLNAPQAVALSGDSFRASRIIDDSKFFRSADMTASQIQSFLNAKVPNCDRWGEEPSGHGGTRAEWGRDHGAPPPYTCLKDYDKDTPARAASSGLCRSIEAHQDRTAAQIINDISRACGVSTRALLVLLQKEQSLITDDWPWPVQYRSATGYGCPDTAPCDSQYYGFFNQVYNAAKQFKRYGKYSGDYNHRAGRNNYVRYNPNSSCGGSTVFIYNQATAGLYNYTPYQPNRAALDNLYGTGNSCSAYGNRNFWRLHHDWFGSTTGGVTLVQEEGDSTVFLLNLGDKMPIPSLSVRAAWGLSDNSVYTYSSETMDIYPTASNNLGRLGRSNTTQTAYFIDRGRGYRMQSSTIRRAWGLHDNVIPTISSTTIGTLQRYPSLTYLIKKDGTDAIYMVADGQKFPISNLASLSLIRGSDGVPALRTFSTGAVGLLTTSPDNMDYTFSVDGSWYVFDNGKVRKIGADYEERWQLDGPELSSYALSLFNQSTHLDYMFRYSNRYYRVRSDGSLQYTTRKTTAKGWGALNSPIISKALLQKID